MLSSNVFNLTTAVALVLQAAGRTPPASPPKLAASVFVPTSVTEHFVDALEVSNAVINVRTPVCTRVL